MTKKIFDTILNVKQQQRKKKPYTKVDVPGIKNIKNDECMK